MKPEILAPLSQAVATFAGAVFVLVGIWYRDKLENAAHAKNSRIQIVAEIRALLDLIELNGYLPGTKGMIERLKNGQFCYLNFSANRSFISVYEANLQNLGHLGGSASEVVRFYMILLSGLEDKDMIVEIGRKIEAKREKGLVEEPRELNELIRRHEFFYAKFAETVRIGEKICDELHYSGRRPPKLKVPKDRNWLFRPRPPVQPVVVSVSEPAQQPNIH
ncbi:MAG: hypothetical protein ACXWR1_10325 [Bdellovibrionota bacterium]